jgi:TonB family protein
MRLLTRALPGLLTLVLFTASPARAETSVWASAPKPSFPKAALSKGSEGYVIVRAYIDASGVVTRAAISKKSGDPLLDDTARTAVLKWRMKPSAIKPEYATSGYTVRFDFREETPVAFRYRDRYGGFSTYEGAQMWKHVSLPEYPIHERGLRAEGTTMVGVVIGPGGEVVSSQVVRTSGYPNLDKAALAAVQHWRAHAQYAGRRFAVPVLFTIGR